MSQEHADSGLNDLFGEIISTYTDEQALDDGVLVDIRAHVSFCGLPVNRMTGISSMICSRSSRRRLNSSDMFFEEQRTVVRRSERVFLDGQGNEWRELRLIVIEAAGFATRNRGN